MIDTSIIMMLLGCSYSTARRRIDTIYKAAKIKCPLDRDSIPVSLFVEYTGITMDDIRYAMERRISNDETQKTATMGRLDA